MRLKAAEEGEKARDIRARNSLWARHSKEGNKHSYKAGKFLKNEHLETVEIKQENTTN